MLGGVTTVLFGLIAVTGARIWVDNRVDFTRTVNLFVAAVTLIIGAADYTVTLGGFSLNGITLGTFRSCSTSSSRALRRGRLRDRRR